MATAVIDKTTKDAANAKPELVLLEEDDFEEFLTEGLSDLERNVNSI